MEQLEEHVHIEAREPPVECPSSLEANDDRAGSIVLAPPGAQACGMQGLAQKSRVPAEAGATV